MSKQLTMHPAPVYVATFSDGTVARMSYWQPMNKPLRQDAARGMVCQAVGNERAWKATETMDRGCRLYSAPTLGVPRRDRGYRPWEPKAEQAGSYTPIPNWRDPRQRLESYRASWFRDHPPVGMRGSLVDRGLAVWATRNSARRELALGLVQPSPAADIIAGHTERKDTGEIIPDPYFEESTVAPLAKPARKPATKAELDRAVALLADLESRFGSQFPAAFGQAQEFLLERMAA